MALWVQRAMPRMVSCWQHLLLHCMLLTQISPSSWRDSLSARTLPRAHHSYHQRLSRGAGQVCRSYYYWLLPGGNDQPLTP